jgi:putative membrane protein
VLIEGLAHGQRSVQPHDLWTAWNLDPVLLIALVVCASLYIRGQRGARKRRTGPAWCFAAAIIAIVIALVSPLEAASAATASAHMIQHVLLILVAAPLFVVSRPLAAFLRGLPPQIVRAAATRGRSLLTAVRSSRALDAAIVVWLLHAGVLWVWHAAVPYGAALDNRLVHFGEHATLIITALLFWRVVLGPRVEARRRYALSALLVFTMGLQSVFLSVLLTFSVTPWYSAYAGTTRAWGLDPLADQQLAGVIMWVPAGTIYVGAAIALFVIWLRAMERDDLAQQAVDELARDDAATTPKPTTASIRDAAGRTSLP